MTLLARRIYYTLSIVFFLALAPIILAVAQGYQWAGWRVGFTPTGVVVISTTPKATVSIDGQVIERTVKLIKRLRPGQYEITLSRDGYTPWKTLVRVRAHAANVIGPVVLLPVSLPINYQGPPVSSILSDPVGHLAVSVQADPEGWVMTPLWPQTSRWKITVTGQPKNIWLSPKGRLLIVRTESGTFVTTPADPKNMWHTDPVDQVFWGDRGDAVLFAQRQNQLFFFDSLAQTETLMATRTSAGWFDRQVWSTEMIGNQTLLYRQSPDALQPILVGDFVGPWLIETGPDGVLLMRNQTDHQTMVYTSKDRDQPVAFGVVDQWWWPDQATAPLWQSGNQLYTLDDRGQPKLLERGPESYQAVYWVVPQHIVVTNDGQEITIRSVSSRQGRGTILKQKMAPEVRLLGVDRGQKILIFQTTDRPVSLFTVSWK